MKRNSGIITLDHGNGGVYMKELIREGFFRHLGNASLQEETDAAVLPSGGELLAFTTDSFVVDPLFFPGGDIGKLAVDGTLNDLAVTGARPMYLSAGFIIEEGFRLSRLERIVRSMARASRASGVKVVTGDTKVVPAGRCDGIYINTSGIGFLPAQHRNIASGVAVEPGDRIILNGPPGEHGMAVLQARKQFPFRSPIRSDCASLFPMIQRILSVNNDIHFMRDATRGGVVTVLHELAMKRNVGIEIEEEAVPANLHVRAFCELLGFDPLYIANEGKVIVVTSSHRAAATLSACRKSTTGRQAAIIGAITGEHPGRVVLRTRTGGRRILDELTGDQLPRIC